MALWNEAKYVDEDGARLEIPAKLSDNLVKEVRDLAIRSFQTLYCEGMARVDFFLTDDDRFIVNEQIDDRVFKYKQACCLSIVIMRKYSLHGFWRDIFQ